MRAKSMVLLLIAGACGLVASIGISQVVERKAETTEVAMGELFVALTDIDIGAKLDASNIRLDKWPRDRIPEGAISKLEDLQDRFPRVRLYAGEPLLRPKLMDAQDRADRAAKIPEGYRVVSVKVTMDEVVSGLVQPGDRVDVIFFVRKNQEIGKTMAQTILKDVRVFAVNSETERSTDTNGEQVIAKTCSLLVKPSQVEAVMLAAELGKLRLSLRRPNDSKTHADDEGIDIDRLLGVRDRRADDRKPQPPDAQPGDSASGILNLLGTPQQPAVPAAAPPVEPYVPVYAAPQKTWTMTVLTPTGSSKYQWTDEHNLPTASSTTVAAPGDAQGSGQLQDTPSDAP